MPKTILCFLLVIFVSLAQSADIAKKDIVKTYISIGLAAFEDSLSSAKALDSAVKAFTNDPNESTLAMAKAAWLLARVPYQQTEVFRFGNPTVDDWEGKVNAWPLDEGLIDYVSTGYGGESGENPLYTVNVIANSSLVVNGKKVNADKITADLLANTIHEAEGVEANVATGYHAIEFLLWGQDLNGTGAGAGTRPASDFSINNCTGGNCERRVAYLRAASELLVADLQEMVEHWKPGGQAVKDLQINDSAALAAMVMGMGSLSYGELAGERMQLGLFLNDPEEEHDCFSDNTHNSHYFDQIGISNVYFGIYKRLNGIVVRGTSLAEYVQSVDSNLAAEIEAGIQQATAALAMLRARAESGEAYDQMLAENNKAGNAMIQASVDALVQQANVLEKLIEPLGLEDVSFEGSDSLDNPEDVFK